MKFRSARAGLIVAAVTLVGCAGGSPTTTVAHDGVSTSSRIVGAPGDIWVAVLGSADDPSRLDADRKRVLAALGDVLEGSVVVSPGSCLDGVPEDLAGGYVLAIQRDSRDDVQALAAQLDGTPLFIGTVTEVCTD